MAKKLTLKAADVDAGIRQGLEKRLASAKGVEARRIKKVLKNDKAFARFKSHLKTMIEDDEDETILDKIDKLIQWILDHQEQIKALIAFITSLFVV